MLYQTNTASQIDENGYRLNVGIILCNDDGQVLWARRVGQDAWQFPQGGIAPQETVEEALYRELWEEVGLYPQHVELVGVTREWLYYDLPQRMIRHGSKPLCIGQKQRWFALRLIGEESDITLDHADKPEFDHWRWVDFWYPLKEVVAFKREVYERALAELEPLVLPSKELSHPSNF